MVDSRNKGQRAEYKVRDMFRDKTGLPWERVPGSGMFGKQHALKGDLYVPNTNYIHCIEVKSYAEDVINSNLLNPSTSQLEKFWAQTSREAGEIGKEPILVFKKDRGKWLVATLDFEIIDYAKESIVVHARTIPPLYIVLLEDWLNIKRKYING
jgi:Holliday junction resolvase